MRGVDRFHPAGLAGWICFALSIFLFSSAFASDEAGRLIERADAVKTANYAEFSRIVEQLRRDASLSAVQLSHLQYLSGWDAVYQGHYKEAVSLLNAVIEDSPDETLRFRARVTVVNALAIAGRHQEGYTRLSQLTAQLPKVGNLEAREQALVVAAILYNEAGQHALGFYYAEKLIQERPTPLAGCKGGQLRLEALHRSGKLRRVTPEFQEAIDRCIGRGEFGYANFVRTYLARTLLEQGDAGAAVALLQGAYTEAQSTRYPRLISEFDAILGEAFLRTGQHALAKQFATRAVEGSVKNEFTKPLVDAYRVLYLLARERGDVQAALGFHEKFAAADKGYLTEASAKAMAFQAVQQQVQARKVEIDALSKRNQVLQLQQKVSKSAAQTRGLLILLLMSVLAFIAMWLYKTKRSQLHFMRLARRDGLTGIFNRAHFADAAEAILAYCRRGEREACVVLIDLDNFKSVNDTHGHAAGDTVLRRTVQACQSHLRSIDIIGRLGGEEFGIVLPDCDPAMGRELAERLRLAIADLSNSETGVGFPVSASFGVTSSRWSGYDLKQLIIHADKALYVAKNHGRNRVDLFDGGGRDAAEPVAMPPGSFDRRRA